MSTRSQIQWDHEVDEPFLPVPGFPTLRLTPYRDTDRDDMIELYNDPIIGQYSFRRPYPYRLADTQWAYDNIIDLNLKPAIAPLRAVLDSPPADGTLPPVLHFPLCVLRYAPSTPPPSAPSRSPSPPSPSAPSRSPSTPSPVLPAADLGALGVKPYALIGNIHIIPSTRETRAAQNFDLPREEQLWELTYDLSPALQGRGIGTAMLQVVMSEWCDWMGLPVSAYVQRNNAASSGILRKTGFVLVEEFLEAWPEDKGGGERLMGKWVRQPLPRP